MKRLFVFLGFSMCLSGPSSAQEGAVTLGYMVEFMSRTGFIVGYEFTDEVGVELHLGSTPLNRFTYGASMKYRFDSDDEMHYALAGVTRIKGDPRLGHKLTTGLNFGYGYEFASSSDQHWRLPVEAGFGPVLTTTVEDRFPLVGFAGFGGKWYSKEFD